jgi:hypothetical protein
MDITDAHRIFLWAIAQYIFFSAAHGNFCKINHILGHKASLNKYKKIQITPCILSDHNALKLELNKKKLHQKIHKKLRAEQHVIQWSVTHRRNKRGNQKVPEI